MGVDGFGVLVTGGGSGIGLAVAKRLAADGAHVTICGRTEEKLASATAQLEAVAAPESRAGHVVADVGSEPDVARAVDAAAERAGGRLDGVATCAGGSSWLGPLTAMPKEEWDKLLSANLTGTMLVLKHAGAVMARARGGSFVGISSIASSNTHRWFGGYGVSKAGVEHLCKLGADELGASRVRVNAVRPGLIRTEMVEAITETESPVRDDYRSCIPLPRMGEAEDIAAMVRFLIGPESAWVTGQVIGVDGGHSLRRGPDLSPWLEPAYGPDALRGATPVEADEQ